jgi:alpha-tubulin suppressor-like RCC1 family protein
MQRRYVQPLIAASNWFTCALLDNGSVKCWGRNHVGQLGLGDTFDRGDTGGEMGDALPAVSLGGTATSIALGNYHACVVMDTTSVKCWGLNSHGHLGQGDTENRGDTGGEMGDALPAMELGTGRTAKSISAGHSHSCAVLDNGTVKCWGRNLEGRLGYGDTDSRGDNGGEMGDALPAVELGTGRTVKSIALGQSYTCAVLDNGSVKCWGQNLRGQLGYGDTENRGDSGGEMGDALPAVELGTGRTAASITAGGDHTCALLDNESVKCWGSNLFGQLGYGDPSTRGGTMGDALPAVELGTGRTAKSIVAGDGHTCAVLDNGTVKCWGRSNYGQLGYGDELTRGDSGGEMGDALPAVELGTGRTAQSISAGDLHTCALLDDGSVRCWGRNHRGQLGYGDTENRGSREGEMGDALPAIDATPGGCACMAGYTLPADGQECAVCGAGTYKADTGNAACSACPANTNSAAGSDALRDCVCEAGFAASSNGVECEACAAGTYKSATGAGSCSACPANSESVTGSSACYCSVGFSRNDAGGACVACSNCESAVTFTASLAMTFAAFDRWKRDLYVAGVARSLSLAPSAVSIASVEQQLPRRSLRRRQESVAVETVARVSKEQVSAVVAAVTAEKLNPSLAAWGMVVDSVSVPTIGSALAGSSSGDGGSGITASDPPKSLQADGTASGVGSVVVMVGAGAGGITLVLAVVVCVWWRCRQKGEAEGLPRHHPALDGAGSDTAHGTPSAPPLLSGEVCAPPSLARGDMWRLVRARPCADRCERQSVTPGDCVSPSKHAFAPVSAGVRKLGDIDQAAAEKVPYTHLSVESAPMAEGSYKSVYKATWYRDGDRGTPVAVALLKLRSAESDAAAMDAEVKVFVQLGKHPHLAILLGTAKHPDGSPCMLVEYAALGSLDNVLAGPSGGRCETSEEVRLTVATQICEGMAQLALHGIVHRDLASRNVSIPHPMRA